MSPVKWRVREMTQIFINMENWCNILTIPRNLAVQGAQLTAKQTIHFGSDIVHIQNIEKSYINLQLLLLLASMVGMASPVIRVRMCMLSLLVTDLNKEELLKSASSSFWYSNRVHTRNRGRSCSKATPEFHLRPPVRARWWAGRRWISSHRGKRTSNRVPGAALELAPLLHALAVVAVLDGAFGSQLWKSRNYRNSETSTENRKARKMQG